MNNLNKKYVDELIVTNYNKLYNMMLLNIRDKNITKDLLQDAILRIYEFEDEKIKEYINNGKLVNLIYNTCYNYSRKNRGNDSYYYIRYAKHLQFCSDNIYLNDTYTNEDFYDSEKFDIDYILIKTNQITPIQKKFFAVYLKYNRNFAEMVKKTGITFQICKDNVQKCIDKLYLIFKEKIPIVSKTPAIDEKQYTKKIHNKLEKNLFNNIN